MMSAEKEHELDKVKPLLRNSNPVRMIILLAFVAILSGAVIYVSWRPDTIKVLILLESAGLKGFLESIRSYTKYVHHIIPEWIVYSLPNGLWAFSYALIISYIWGGERGSILKVFWLGSIIAVGLGYEFLQYLKVISGTFCFQDLLLCTIGIILGVIINKLQGCLGK